jgi:hypothetical protein
MFSNALTISSSSVLNWELCTSQNLSHETGCEPTFCHIHLLDIPPNPTHIFFFLFIITISTLISTNHMDSWCHQLLCIITVKILSSSEIYWQIFSLSKTSLKTCTCSSSRSRQLVDRTAMITMRSCIYISTDKVFDTWTESSFISQQASANLITLTLLVLIYRSEKYSLELNVCYMLNCIQQLNAQCNLYRTALMS